jgi:hypothetical protein
MPWTNVTLNDGKRPCDVLGVNGCSYGVRRPLYADHCVRYVLWCPITYKNAYETAPGTWKIGNGQGPIDNVKTAINVGFTHVGAFIHLHPAF